MLSLKTELQVRQELSVLWGMLRAAEEDNKRLRAVLEDYAKSEIYGARAREALANGQQSGDCGK